MKSDSKTIEYNRIQELKNSTDIGLRFERNVEHNYKIRIINRSEQLFYQQEDIAFICEINPHESIIFKDSIKKWDNGVKITDDEKEVIFDRLILYFKKFQDNIDAKIV
jgi:hypothetical protein